MEGKPITTIAGHTEVVKDVAWVKQGQYIEQGNSSSLIYWGRNVSIAYPSIFNYLNVIISISVSGVRNEVMVYIK